MKTYFLLIILIICSSLLQISQADSCSLNLNLTAVQFPFNLSSLHCSIVWNVHDFVLRYAQTSSNLWSFVLSKPDTNSYLGMGFSDDGLMVGSSAIVGWISSDGYANVKQYSLRAQIETQVIPDSGDLNISYSTIISQSTRIYLAFQLVTHRPSSRIIYSIGPVGMLPSSPSYRLMEHRDKISTALNYVTSETSNEDVDGDLRRSHGMLNMVGWGILMIIGGIIGRYFRHWDPIWFYAHIGIQSLGFIIGISGVICGFFLEDLTNARVSIHKGIGIFILVLSCLQVIMAFLVRPDKLSKVRKYWNWYHYSAGKILMAFAIANVFYGLHLGEKESGWSGKYGIVLAILFIISLVLEVKFWKRN
ncbi:cytochrome b561 and DOMON domain-containing protein At3g07570-like [Mercurialis annua]|uniref:cytochrome b561 and DOMON domain-containing protein At3g07570-like n=1 Tax=Mercurialis annua TaxID=3986 RepID=UPI00215F4CA5|nr:cytochrome b561 and DOMON domain-containing protein At3g07570-like [Mercurialis annua]